MVASVSSGSKVQSGISISTDFGLTWVGQVNLPPAASFALSNDGAFMAVSTTSGKFYTSDSTPFTGGPSLYNSQGTTIELLCAGNGQFVILNPLPGLQNYDYWSY
jgi:hypothetical protein